MTAYMVVFAIVIAVLAVSLVLLTRWAFRIHRYSRSREWPLAVGLAVIGAALLLVYMGVLLPAASGSGEEGRFLFIVVGGVVAVVQGALAVMLYVWRTR
jgi:hypothetical protein